MLSNYHIPVFKEEVAEYLINNINGIYVDGTIGAGGHAEYLLNKLSQKSFYIGIDRDSEALEFARKKLHSKKNIVFKKAGFADIDSILGSLQVKKIDGLLLDLGVSSHQIDSRFRGFSYMHDTELDMRMDTELKITAASLLNSLDEKDLADIFFKYGEEKKARQIARLIVSERTKKPFQKTVDLKKIIDKVVYSRFAVKSYARIFQALRIEVNSELEQLKVVLKKSMLFLNPGGRIVVLSYHSLEDKIVKNFFKEQANPCICPPDLPVCACGRKADLKILTKKALKPEENEIKNNPRARSAKLRAGEKI